MELADDKLFAAARAGDAFRVASLLQRPGADVNARNYIRDTPLVVACDAGHGAVVTTLLRAGADPNAAYRYGASPLALASERGDTTIVEELLAAGARVDHTNTWGATPLHAAASKGFVDVVKLLLRAGADTTVRDKTGSTPLQEAEQKGHMDIVRLMRNERRVSSSSVNFDSETARELDVAVTSGKLEAVRELVRNGASLATVSRDGSPLLHRAVTSNQIKTVEFLLSQKVEIDAIDSAGWTAIHHAVRSRSKDLVTILLKHNANVNLQTKGRRGEPATRYEASVLHLAIRSDDTEILTLLLAHKGLDLNLRNDQGRTPLVYAVSLDRGEAVKRLIEAGADVNIRADAGESALLLASHRGRAEDVHALLRVGARTDVVARSGRTPLSEAKSPEQRELIQLYQNSQLFHDKCFAFLSRGDEPPTIDKLTELVPLITAVYDLRHMLTLVAMCEPSVGPTQKRELLKAAFLHVVDRKLTYDDDACVFFKLCLELCERDKLLTREDFLLLDRKAEKINTESADWVIEMKKQVYSNSWRLDTHDRRLNVVVDGLNEVHTLVMENRKVLVKVSRRVSGLKRQIDDGKKLMSQLHGRVGHMSKDMNRLQSRLSQSEANIEHVAANLLNFRQAYVDRLDQEERNKKIKRVCGIVASVAGFVFAPVLKEMSEAIVDFMNPIEFVEKVYMETDIARFLSDGSENALPQVIQEQLEKYAIPQDEFEAVLREEIVLQHPEYLAECATRGLAVSVDGGRSELARSYEPSIDEEEIMVLKIVGELQALRADEPASVAAPPSTIPRGPNISTSEPIQMSHVVASSGLKSPARASITSREGETPLEAVQKLKISAPKPPNATASHRVQSAKSPVADGKPVILFRDDLNDFPFHAAVHESHGQLSEFVGFAELIEPQSCDPMGTMRLQIRSITSSHESLCAAEYAYRRRYQDIGDFLVSRMPSSSRVDKGSARSVKLLDDEDNYPFVVAVDERKGDLEEFKTLVQWIDPDDHSLDARIQASIERVTSESVKWTAVEYACYLGYEEIVGYMLKELHKSSIPARAKFQLLKTVRERAKMFPETPSAA